MIKPFYQLLPTCAPGFVPASNDTNLRVAIAHRLLTPPPMLPGRQQAAWAARATDYQWLFLQYEQLSMTYWDDHVDSWVEHFNDLAKKKSYRKIVAGINSGEVRYAWQREAFGYPDDTQLFVKHDELLMQQKEGAYTLKPRIIANVCPEFQAVVGPYVYAAQKHVGKIWHTEPGFIVRNIGSRSITFHFCTGGGKTDRDLSDWMENVLAGRYFQPFKLGFAILVCGDDSVVVKHSPTGDLQFFEADARMFDQSQSLGPLQAEYFALQCYGVPSHVCDMLLAVASNRYVVRPAVKDKHLEPFYLDKKARPIRDTGGADTYLGNTLVMAMAWFLVLTEPEQNYSVESCVAGFFRLGFDMKMSTTADYQEVTFLKGMWYPNGDRAIWGPLPSRILKVGKSLEDPRSYYPGKTMAEAARLFLGSIANSYSVFYPVPILRAFVSRYKSDLTEAREVFRNPYATVGSGEYSNMSSDESYLSLAKRYGIELHDIIRVEKLIARSEALCLLNDPAFLKMAEVDYK